MTPELAAAIISPIIGAILTLATLYYKDRADARRVKELQNTASKAALSAVVAADEAAASRAELGSKLDAIHTEVNGKVDHLVSVAHQVGIEKGRVEAQKEGC